MQCIRNLDSDIKTSTHWPGLKFLVYNALKTDPEKGGSLWSSSGWKEWPSITACQDQGPDMTSSVHCMAYRLGVCLMVWWDWSHGVAADLKLVLKGLDLWPLMILTLVVNNVGF